MKVNDNSMILNKIYIDKAYFSMDKSPFAEGDLIEGEILDVIDNIAFIEVKDLGLIKALTQGDLNHQKGKVLTFIVKSSSPNKIELKPILNHIEDKESLLEIKNQSKNYLINILKEFHIKDDPVSIEFLDSLIKYNVKINKKNVLGGIKIIDKIEQLLNLDNNEMITLANWEKEILNIGKEDIRNFIIIDKEQNKDDLISVEKTQSSKTGKEDITSIVKEYLTESSLNDKIDSDIIKIISFLLNLI